MKVVLTVTEGPHAGKQFTFGEHDNFIVGRHSTAHFRLPARDPYFSRLHFMVEVNAPHCRLMDMGSRNGTQVNGTVVERADLKHGDQIRGGQTLIQVAIVQDSSPAVSPPAAGQPAGSAPPVNSGQPTLAVKSDMFPGNPTVSPGGVPTGRSANETIEAGNAQGETWEDDRAAGAPPILGGRADGKESVWATNVDPAVDRPVKTPSAVNQRPPDLAKPASTGLQLAPEQRALLPADYERLIAIMRQSIPGYLLIDEVGRGGMGVVYRAIQESSGKVAAIKAIHPSGPVSDSDIERFLRETRILQELRHPNIVAFQEMGEADGQLYFAMEFVKGTDALKLTQDANGLGPIPQAVGIICQLLLALEYAHQQGFVHRDIKPANLLLTQYQGRGLVKLADFGLARTYQTSRMSGLTVMGETGGTPAFMPPEQITHYRDAKPPVDQYAAAATLYYLLTKQCIHNFPRDICQQLLLIMQQDCVPVTQRRPDVHPRLEQVIHRALQRDPEKRFASVAEFRQHLLPFCKQV